MNAEELRLLDERICDKCAYEMRYSRKCRPETCTLLFQIHSEIERAGMDKARELAEKLKIINKYGMTISIVSLENALADLEKENSK